MLTAGLSGCFGPSATEQFRKAQQQLERGNASAAILEARSGLSDDERSAFGRFLLGQALLLSGDLAGAEVELGRAAEYGHDPGKLAPALARLWLAQGKPSKVIQEYGAATREAGPDLLTQVATAHVQRDDPQRAREAIALVLQGDPDHAPALLLRARLEAAAGDTAAAMATVAAVLQRHPDDASAHLTRGDLLARSGDAAALDAYRRAVALQPTLEQAHSGLLQRLLATGASADFKAAVAAMAKALPGRPTTVYYQAIAAYQAGEFGRARELAQWLTRGANDQVEVLFLAAMVELQFDALARAESLLERAVMLNPDAVETRRELARLQIRLDQPQKALATLKPMLDRGVKDAALWAAAGQAHVRDGNFKAADAAFATADKLQPGDAAVRIGMARSLLARGEVDAGVKELERLASAQRQGVEADLALVAVQVARGRFDAALKATEAIAAKSPPASSLAQLVRGRVLETKGDLAAARAAYADAVARNPRDLAATSSLANLDIRDGKLGAARARYEAFLKLEPKSGRALMAMAVLERRGGGSREAAAAWVDKAVAAEPMSTGIWRSAIEFHSSDGDRRAALARAQAATAALPDDPGLLADLGAAQLQSRELQQAVTTLQRLAQLAPRSVDAQLRLAQAHAEAGNLGAARAQVGKALELAPDAADALRASARLELLGDKTGERALAVARQVQSRWPQSALGWLLEGETAESLRQHPRAAAAYRQALAKQPQPGVALALHRSLLAGGSAAEAEAFERRWLAQEPGDALFLGHLALVAEQRGELAAAAARYRQAIALRPDEVVFVNNLAVVLARQKQPEAIELAQRAQAMAPTLPAVLDTMAFVHASSGAFDKAVEWQTRAVDAVPDSAALRLGLARYLIAAKRQDRAKTELERVTRTAGATEAEREAAYELLRKLGA